ncbi:MAG: hypothetical protein HY785_26900 [Oscillatoriophycideae cyanobacterium NC_groundwater_1537_Pr4_S-0.65um_50_18]|nr:hypothetical protein [Oscillatoriophycideae cyanobacterium NC_groundwater_1537_Pr4_S-0.65um_50_18]
MVLATSVIPPIAASSLLSEVAKELASDQNALRIKKLMLFACTQKWENDSHRLQEVNLLELVKRLLAIAPTLEQLQSRIHGIANSLNKSAEYTLIANAIINRVSRLYLETCPVGAGAGAKDYEAVAQILACDPDHLRIKKLLILASKNIWETDANRLNSLPFLDLVQEVHDLTPTPESLKAVLDNLAKTLSKKTEYEAIAERVCLIFQSLYFINLSAPALEMLDITLTEGILEASLGASSESLPEPSCEAMAQPQQPYAYIRQQALPDFFDLRVSIMQSANPMRVKILLFTLMHEVFTPGAEHDSLLKNHELDDLLQILLQTHKLLSDLESKLLSAARSLQESDEYAQVAQVLLRSLKPFYTYLPLKAGLPTSADEGATNIVSVEAGLPGTTEPNSQKGDGSPSARPDHTCQVLTFERAIEISELQAGASSHD